MRIVGRKYYIIRRRRPRYNFILLLPEDFDSPLHWVYVTPRGTPVENHWHNVLLSHVLCIVLGLPQHTKNREHGGDIDGGGGGGRRMVGLLVGALTAATVVMAGVSVAFVMVRRRRTARRTSRRSRSASFQGCTSDKPQLPPAIHLTVSPRTRPPRRWTREQ